MNIIAIMNDISAYFKEEPLRSCNRSWRGRDFALSIRAIAATCSS